MATARDSKCAIFKPTVTIKSGGRLSRSTLPVCGGRCRFPLERYGVHRRAGRRARSWSKHWQDVLHDVEPLGVFAKDLELGAESLHWYRRRGCEQSWQDERLHPAEQIRCANINLLAGGEPELSQNTAHPGIRWLPPATRQSSLRLPSVRFRRHRGVRLPHVQRAQSSSGRPGQASRRAGLRESVRVLHLDQSRTGLRPLPGLRSLGPGEAGGFRPVAQGH